MYTCISACVCVRSSIVTRGWVEMCLCVCESISVMRGRCVYTFEWAANWSALSLPLCVCLLRFSVHTRVHVHLACICSRPRARRWFVHQPPCDWFAFLQTERKIKKRARAFCIHCYIFLGTVPVKYIGESRGATVQFQWCNAIAFIGAREMVDSCRG